MPQFGATLLSDSWLTDAEVTAARTTWGSSKRDFCPYFDLAIDAWPLTQRCYYQ